MGYFLTFLFTNQSLTSLLDDVGHRTARPDHLRVVPLIRCIRGRYTHDIRIHFA
jgi:hypothetical protein